MNEGLSREIGIQSHVVDRVFHMADRSYECVPEQARKPIQERDVLVIPVHDRVARLVLIDQLADEAPSTRGHVTDVTVEVEGSTRELIHQRRMPDVFARRKRLCSQVVIATASANGRIAGCWPGGRGQS